MNKRYNSNYPKGRRTFFHATLFALNGIRHGARTEDAIKVELIVLLCAIPIAKYIAKDWLEFVILILPCFILLIVEFINTAIEKTVDRISLEKHHLSKIAKDSASAAVFISVCLLILIWVSKLLTFI